MTCATLAAQAAPQSLFDLVVAGGPLMVPIVLASVIALGLAVERWIRLSSTRLGDAREALALVGAVREAGPRALALCDERPNALARVIAVGLRHAGRPFLEREKLVEEAAAREVGGLSKGLEPLLVVHLVAPLLGLLGTVWGMIVAFGQIALSDGLGRPELLADGIQQALVTTAAGLCVAIPALLLHRWLAAKVERFARRLEEAWLGVEDALAARAELSGAIVRVRRRESELPTLSIAPLVDVVFLLVIFFMVATTWLDPEKRLDLELPEARSGREAERDEELVIQVLPEGQLLLDGRAIGRAELEGALADAARHSRGTAVTIRGDRRVPHGEIVSVLDACGLAGLSNLSVGALEP